MDSEIKKMEELVKDAVRRGSYRVNLLQTYLKNMRRKNESK